MTAGTGTRHRADQACVEAVGLARAAAVETGGAAAIGDHTGYDVDGPRVVTHYFDCRSPGYRGWRWAVTVARAARSGTVTVDECVLLPGLDAIVAPVWVPWDDRVQPTDLGPGDLLPTTDDDPRLMPGYTAVDVEPDIARIAIDELGLHRVRVLSPLGRDEAAERWRAGPGGPHTEIARAAPYPCATCGFLVPLAGSLGRAFGACANERSPFDRQVVSVDHGCGAHSEVRVSRLPASTAAPVLDTFDDEAVLALPGRSGGDEELGHS